MLLEQDEVTQKVTFIKNSRNKDICKFVIRPEVTH